MCVVWQVGGADWSKNCQSGTVERTVVVSAKALLIELLNTILPHEAQVADIIEYRDREQPKDSIYSKGSRMGISWTQIM